MTQLTGQFIPRPPIARDRDVRDRSHIADETIRRPLRDEGYLIPVLSGQVCGFLGPSGSGKTTTIGMLLGTIRPTGGAVRLFGAADGMPLLDARRRIGAVLETPGLYSYLSAEDNLRISACVMGVSHARIGAVLDIVKLAPDRRLRVSKFSLGMRQRLSLAAALPSDPDLLILDEPTSGLNRFLIARGVTLTEMTQRRQTVEDFFLAAMRNGGAEKEVIA